MARSDVTRHRLLEWNAGRVASEDLAAQILHAEGYEDLDPAHPLGGPDGLKDVTAKKGGKTWVAGAYFPTGRKSVGKTRKKFLKDHAGVAANNADAFAFVTNQKLTETQRDDFANAVEGEVAIYHLDRVASVLDRPENAQLRKEFLGIEPGDGATLDKILAGQERLAELLTGGDTRRGVLRRRIGQGLTQPPRPPADFVGREPELEELASRLDDGAVLVVSGIPGVGKSALAHKAAACAEGFDTIIHLDLRAEQRPAPADRNLRRLLSTLGYDDAVLPSKPDELEIAWGQATTSHRVLLVVDDVVAEEEIRALLPQNAGAVLITARHALPGITGARHMVLGELGSDDSERFLRISLDDDRVDAEPEAAADLHGLCCGLPLALRISAARLLTRPAWTLSGYADRLRDERARLARLEVGDISVRASFNLSYDLLSADEQRAFRSVGLFGGPTLEPSALSAAAEFDTAEAVEAILDAQLLTGGANGVLEVHDLLRVYAHERIEAEEDDVRRRSGLQALATWYRHQAELRHAAMLGSATDEPPLAWLDREFGNIGAVARQLADEELWDVAAALVMDVGPLYGASQRWRAWDDLLVIGERTADALADTRLRAKIMLNRGIAADNLGELDRGAELLANAEVLARDVGDVGDEARALAQQGTILKKRGDAEGALRLTGRALELYRKAGDRHGEARALGDLANQTDDLGGHEDAVEIHRRAMAAFHEIGDRHGEAIEHGNLGIALMRLGELSEADDELAAAEEIHRTLGARRYLAETWGRRGEVALRKGDAPTAVRFLDDAIAELEQLDDAWLLASELGLRSEARRVIGDGDAIEDARRAVEILETLNDPFALAISLGRLAIHLREDPEQCLLVLERAEKIFAAYADRPHPARVTTLTQLAVVARSVGQVERADTLFQRAEEVATATNDVAAQANALLNRAQFEAEVGRADNSDDHLSKALELGVEMDSADIEALAEGRKAQIDVNAPTAELDLLLQIHAREALRLLDWAIEDLRIDVVDPSDVPNAANVNVNAERVTISREFLPDKAPSDPLAAIAQDARLRFIVNRLMAQHVLMRLGVQSRGDTGSLMIELAGEWFARWAHLKASDEMLPFSETALDPEDPYQVGRFLGAAYAGSDAAHDALQKANPELVDPVTYEPTKREFRSSAPIKVLRDLATGYREIPRSSGVD